MNNLMSPEEKRVMDLFRQNHWRARRLNLTRPGWVAERVTEAPVIAQERLNAIITETYLFALSTLHTRLLKCCQLRRKKSLKVILKSHRLYQTPRLW